MLNFKASHGSGLGIEVKRARIKIVVWTRLTESNVLEAGDEDQKIKQEIIVRQQASGDSSQNKEIGRIPNSEAT